MNQRNRIDLKDQTDEIDRTDQMNKTGWLNFFSILLVGWLAIQFTHKSDMNAWAGSQSSNKSTKAQGDAELGKAVFNGKGVCYYCHGIDGYRGQQPQLAADTAALIAQLNPPPVDLRNPKVLHLKTDKQRARAIREGHTGTGMFPDTTMTDQELRDTLAYLALLRSEGSAKRK
jgi:mono/diheme cytochrome c family protein